MGFWTRAAQLVRPVAVADSAASRPAVSRPEGAWISLPVIQRVVTPLAPVAERAPFVASLRTHQNPSFLAPLAHLIDPDGPSGRIGGLVTPAATVQRAAEQEPEMQRQWPQHFADEPLLRSAPPSLPEPPRASPPQSARASAPVAQRSVGDAPSSPAAPIGTPDADPGAGALHHLPVRNDAVPVQRSLTAAAVSEPVFRTLPALTTTAPEDVAPQPPAVSAGPTAQRDVVGVDSPDVAVARVEDASAVAPPVQPLVAVDTRSGDGRLPGIAEPSPRTHPETPVQRTNQAPPSSAAVPPLPEQLRTQPPRFDEPPAGERVAPVQRTPASSPGATAPSRPVATTPFSGATFPSTPTTPDVSAPASSTRDSVAASSPLSSTALQRTTPQHATAQHATPQHAIAQRTTAQHVTPERTTAEHATAQRAAAPAEPLAGTELFAGTSPTRALRTPFDSPQGAAVPHPPPESGSVSESAPAPAPAVQRIAPPPPARLGLGAPLERAPAPATRIETVSLQEWAELRAEPAAAPPIPATTSHNALPAAATTDAPIANPPVIQRLVGAPPHVAIHTGASPVRAHGDIETTQSGRSSASTESWPMTAPGPAGTPRVQRLVQPDPVAQRAAATPRDAGSIAVAAGIAQRDADGTVVFGAPETETVAQRAVDTDEMRVDTEAPQPAAAQPGTPATAAPQAPNLDDLARRLYDPLAARLKAELRLDRERFGLVTDVYR